MHAGLPILSNRQLNGSRTYHGENQHSIGGQLLLEGRCDELLKSLLLSKKSAKVVLGMVRSASWHRLSLVWVV